MAMKDSTKKILTYLQSAQAEGRRSTAADVAEALELTPQQVNGGFTMGIQKRSEHKYGYRQEEEIEVDGKHVTVKYLVLTDEGMSFDPDAEVAE